MFKIKSLVLALGITLLGSSIASAAPYTVKSGDSLYKISQAYNTTSNTLMKNNGLTSSTIYIGQKLEVPANIYKVVSGDTLYLISKRYGVTIDQIRLANNKWDNNLYIGEILNIPYPTSNNTQSAASVIPYSESDVNLLARLITAEAGGESYNAMVSVGAVIINRVKSPIFPNTISGVIYDTSYGYYQFTPVANGMINKAASQTAINAAYDALKGTDPTKGALYFYDNTVTNTWLTSKPIALRVGNLTFAY